MSKTAKAIPVEDIRKLVNYLFQDESRHAEECGDDLHDHIFHSVLAVANWLEQNGTPCDYSMDKEFA